MSSATIRTGIDAWIDSTAPSTTFGTGKWLRCVAPAGLGGTTREAYLFLKSPVPRRAVILSATLRLYGVGSGGGSRTVSVRRLSEKWSESHIDFNHAPSASGATVSVTATQSADGLEWAFDVSAQLQAVADGSAFYGWLISTTATTEQKFYSLDAADFKPVLHVEWALAPDAPTELTPSGGAAVSIGKPVLSFNFHDVAGAEGMQACQVQIYPTAFIGGTPDFDSGTVATADPELDLSATAYGGISNGATKWWRVRVQNESGAWSPWSDAVSFTRVNKMTLTINNPAAHPNDFVEDPTPEFFWTVSPGPQLARRIILADDADPTRPFIDTGRQTTSETTFTPAPGQHLVDEDTVYRLTVRVWENNTRTQTPGDKVYLEATRTFTFQEDPTPDPVTGLAAAQVSSDKPHVRLTWSRATAPDGFTISRDGKVIAHDLDPADLFTSGTSYAFVDVTAQPHTLHTWKVRPRVNGKVGPNRGVDLRYEVDDVWLTDLDTPARLVPIIVTSDAAPSFDMPEIAGVLRPVDGNRVVRLVQGQYGLEGHVEGYIADHAGGDANDWVANLLWMKARPENTLRITFGDQNLRVKIGNVVVAPLDGGDTGWRHAAFDFWSIDGVTQR